MLTDLFAGLVVLPEEMVKDGAVLLVYALHLVDVLSHLNPEPHHRVSVRRTKNTLNVVCFFPL
jgi:hypothetical protein